MKRIICWLVGHKYKSISPSKWDEEHGWRYQYLSCVRCKREFIFIPNQTLNSAKNTSTTLYFHTDRIIYEGTH